ncbi:Na+/H+ antiporter NhaC family protein [Virgibacillus salexigens]|uniref:Na+/H+ antiporter NhaC family protein n=1 Tax=Virgibacillus TaxID=84406 RepID=UPI001371E4BF|nr:MULTISPECIES: Na+/H+ antiporter NhaC family protein [Virgibacillus]MYL40631.1 sodium:proton antiporter [Virgibacillus massiliensis]
MEHYGWISMVPALCVLSVALITKRTIESLIFGSIIGFIILEKQHFFSAFVDSSLSVMGDPTIGWIILVILSFGGLIALLVKSGGALAFGEFVSSKVKTKKGALLITWVMGIVIFLDDYLNALTVSTSMQKITDKHRTSREFLAYVVDSTAAPVCVLIPLSTWTFYVSGLFEDLGLAASGNGSVTYVTVIPFILYGWVALFIVLLAIFGIIPKLGPMKIAEKRAEEMGICLPEGSKDSSIVDVDVAASVETDAQDSSLNGNQQKKVKPKLINFFVPIGVLIFYTWYSGIDVLQGVLVALIVMIIMLVFQRLMSLGDLFDTFFEGFKPMIYPLGIVVSSFILVDVNNSLGLTEYVIETIKPFMSPGLLPVVSFLAMALVAFATGSFWGVYAITLPIIIPLAEAMGTNIWLAVGAVLSAGAFGSHACPYGDTTVLSASGSGIDAITHVITQAPYVLLSGCITAIGYLVLGFII